MAKISREIIKIDEDRCNGCGLCVSACAEGALQIIDGKARLVSETYCDGLGACLGDCPVDAITIETRVADDFDEVAVAAKMAAEGKPVHTHAPAPQPAQYKPSACNCPSANLIDRTREARQVPTAAAGEVPSELRQWPIKLYLVNPQAPYFADADLLVAADCVPFAYGGVHADFMRGKTIVTGCPKFDDTELYLSKLTDILSSNDIKSVTVLKMEVPCCGGMQRIAEMAVSASGKNVAVETVTIALDGSVK